MTDPSQYQLIHSVVKQVIHAWDPYCLLHSGAPEDEWDSQVLQIVSRAKRIHSTSDAAAVLSEVFTQSLHPETFSREVCAPVGENLFKALHDAGLIRATEQTDAAD